MNKDRKKKKKHFHFLIFKSQETTLHSGSKSYTERFFFNSINWWAVGGIISRFNKKENQCPIVAQNLCFILKKDNEMEL